MLEHSCHTQCNHHSAHPPLFWREEESAPDSRSPAPAFPPGLPFKYVQVQGLVKKKIVNQSCCRHEKQHFHFHSSTKVVILTSLIDNLFLYWIFFRWKSKTWDHRAYCFSTGLHSPCWGTSTTGSLKRFQVGASEGSGKPIRNAWREFKTRNRHSQKDMP